MTKERLHQQAIENLLDDVLEFSIRGDVLEDIPSDSCKQCGGNCNNCGSGNCNCQSCGGRKCKIS